MINALETMVDILHLEPLEQDRYRGTSPDIGWQRVFGGQVIGQALVAAQHTIKDRSPHSLHGYFVLPGDPHAPILYEVTRIRDGGSFTTRSVHAFQHERIIFTMTASFHRQETGLTHQTPMPVDILQPEDLPSDQELKQQLAGHVPASIRRYWERERPVEVRYGDLTHFFSKKKLPPYQYVWFRATHRLPDTPSIHQAVLAYASDFSLLDTALYPHGRSIFDPKMQVASLDHALWFHRPFRADAWLVYIQDSPSSSGARGFARGAIYTRDGILIASTAQEGLIRLRQEKPSPL